MRSRGCLLLAELLRILEGVRQLGAQRLWGREDQQARQQSEAAEQD